jgi:hypothetical protein
VFVLSYVLSKKPEVTTLDYKILLLKIHFFTMTSSCLVAEKNSFVDCDSVFIVVCHSHFRGACCLHLQHSSGSKFLEELVTLYRVGVASNHGPLTDEFLWGEQRYSLNLVEARKAE